jgi:hypothetical protein
MLQNKYSKWRIVSFWGNGRLVFSCCSSHDKRPWRHRVAIASRRSTQVLCTFKYVLDDIESKGTGILIVSLHSESGVVFGWGDNTEFSLGMTAAGPWVGVPQPIVISNGPCSNVNVTAIASGGNADAWVQNSTIDSPFTIFSLSGPLSVPSRKAACCLICYIDLIICKRLQACFVWNRKQRIRSTSCNRFSYRLGTLRNPAIYFH